jgi:hypothetical protein
MRQSIHSINCELEVMFDQERLRDLEANNEI